ncbi:TIGR03986 family CRISPR-associated RAMP protein [Microbispora sp. NPDC049125]|uniref:TIGR03986 family type III CRISPR-associated RAMP protein n=1 Tax=Microbispora sp. NPDC049125 TaxID=3154929 RepID=UPI0034661572
MADEFLNPYTFVPAFPREDLPEQFHDGRPPARDRLREDSWTGRIGIRLTVETALLLLDTPRGRPPSEDGADHLVYPVRLRDGRPHLPATSVKGMLRAAYEAVTNSRFGVFGGHDTPLGFRRDAGYALGMVPVYVAAEGVLGKLEIASLEMYDKAGQSIYGKDEAPKHLQKLRAVISGGRKGGNRVVRLVRGESPERLPPGQRLVHGMAYITGANIEGKTSERFLYLEPLPPGSKREPLPLGREWSALLEDWDRLIQSYRDAHSKAELFERRRQDGGVAGPEERIGVGPGQLAWSPHIHDQEWMTLKPKMACYARMKDGKVDRLYPVLVPRDLYPVAPSALLPASLAPAPSYEQLSPADRLFGWVAPNGSGARPAAYRGRLRVGPVVCEQVATEAVDRFDGDGLPLAILSAPKPQQGRFYLAESADRPDRPVPDRTPKEQLYQAGRGLRGRKAYWHHAGLDPTQHWSEGQGKIDPAQVRVGRHFREFRRSRAPLDDYGSPTRDSKRYATRDAEQRDSQNRSIKGWVRPKTTFRFVVDIRDLDEHELGALAWLLDFPPGHFHRLGYGRPLGFGSVRLDVDYQNTELHSGRDYADYYRSLSAPLPDEDPTAILDQARKEFERLVESSPQLVAIRDALLTVARGNPGLPVHYPRVRPSWRPEGNPAPPDPRGQNYEWFTANERMSGDVIAPGRGRSLPTAVNPSAELVIYSTKNAGNDRGARAPKNGKFNGKSAGSSSSDTRRWRREMG